VLDSSGPEIFALGSISTELPEFAVSFTPDGETAYFNRTNTERSELAIMVSRWDGSSWSPAAIATFSGEFFDVDPFVTPDGSRLYFSSNRSTLSGDTVPNFNTWFVDLEGEEIAAAQPLPEPFNSEASEIFVSGTRDGTLYFRSDRDGTSRTYRASVTDAGPSVEVVPIDMNLTDGIGNPLIAPDERFLLFVPEAPSRAGAADVYISYRTPTGWTPGEVLGGGVNSSYTDFAPALGPNGEYLYFTSERPGVVPGVEEGVRPPGDIYRISLQDAGIR
jgi:Tol biopolymer transport system component